MKKILLSLILLFGLYQSYGQSFFNGDFEINIATGCDYNLVDADFNLAISNVYAFGGTYSNCTGWNGETDIQTTGCYVTPQHGNWCIGLGSGMVSGTCPRTDAVAIKLNANLTPGKLYKLSFYLYGNTSFSSGVTVKIAVGASLTNTDFGLFIDSVAPAADTWVPVDLFFTAAQASQYITVTDKMGISAWNQIDNFSISDVTGIETTGSPNPNVTVFPNPSSGVITVQLENNPHLKNIILKNYMGQIILSTTAVKIDLSQLKPGIYFAEVITDEGKCVCRVIRN